MAELDAVGLELQTRHGCVERLDVAGSDRATQLLELERLPAELGGGLREGERFLESFSTLGTGNSRHRARQTSTQCQLQNHSQISRQKAVS